MSLGGNDSSAAAFQSSSSLDSGDVEDEERKSIDETDLAVAVEWFPLYVILITQGFLIRQYLTWYHFPAYHMWYWRYNIRCH